MPINALDAVFAQEGTALALPGGAVLIAAGETTPALYRVTAGRLAEIEAMAEGGGKVLGIHRPGDLIGGGQLLGGARRFAAVTALRDSELQAIPASRALQLLKEEPDFLAAVARAALAPMAAPSGAERRKSAILGFVAVCDTVAMRDLAERLAIAMRDLGADVAVIGAEARDKAPAWLSALEIENDFVIMAAERSDPEFTAYCGRQIDRLVLVGGADTPLPERAAPFAAAALQKQRLMDFILVQPPGTRRPRESERWLGSAPASRLFQVRDGDAEDLARLARVYTGNSVGLALSGGGARAYAHVGAVRALRELGVPIDFLGGTSMGAVIAAGVAMEWDDEELDRRIRNAFVESSPLSDIAFPLLAMTRGGLVDHRLKTHFDAARIGDLWRPFTCISTDLTAGAMRVHRRGSLRHALRASLSLPGVLPPVIDHGHVLVDGAMANNLPTGLVREQHDGVTIGVDAAAAHGLKPDDLLLKPSGLRWLTSGAWRKGPPIVSVLISSATIPTVGRRAPDTDDSCIVLSPDLGMVGLQDWKAYDMAVEAGYRSVMEAADRLEPLRR